MADRGTVNISNLAMGAVFNALVTGGAHVVIDSRLPGYSPWQKAAIASGVGTIGLGVLVIVLSGTRTA